MSDRKLTILGLVAIGMVVWAIAQSELAQKISGPAENVSFYLLQGLEPDIIKTIAIKSDNNKLTLQRSGKVFLVVEKDGYPAETQKVNELIATVLDIKVKDKITDNPANFDDLQVADANSQRTVKLLGADANTISGIILGKRADSGGSYIRLVDSNDVYLAQNSPWIRSSVMDYIEQELFNIDQEKILSVIATEPNESYTLLSEPNSTEVTMQDMPADKKLKSDAKQVFSALSSLSFNDVMAESKMPDLNFDRSYVCKLNDERIYTFDVAQKEDKAYVKCHAEYTGRQIYKEERIETEKELKEKEVKLLAQEDVRVFNRDRSGWVYEIAQLKAKNLTKTRGELLEDKKPPEETEQTDAG